MPPFSFTPGIQNTVFSPDILIAGSHPIVTDAVTIASGQVLTRGTLIGKQMSGVSTASAAAKAGGNTGNGTFGTITPGAGAKEGVYVLTMTAATTFTITDPNGDSLPGGSTGVAYSNAALAFTLTAGGTAFVAGDAFNITVTQGTGAGKWVKATASATDGSQLPNNWAILASDIDTSATGYNADTANVAVYISGEFNTNAMTFGSGLTGAIAKEALVRSGISLFLKTSQGNAIV